MIAWLAPLVAGVGLVAWRSWHRDAAIRSGELMEVRDLGPERATASEVRVLANRLYRVELQVELEAIDDGAEASGVGAPPTDADPREEAIVELAVFEADESGAASVPLHHGVLPFDEALGRALRAGLGAASRDRRGFQGTLPLLELETDAIVRLRFEIAVAGSPQGPAAGDAGATSLSIAKAHVVVKENVRRLSLGGDLPGRLTVAARSIL